MPKKGLDRYRPDRREELLAKARKSAKETQKRKWLEKQKNYNIRRDDPLDDRV